MSDHDIDDAVGAALAAEVDDLHADDELLDRIHHSRQVPRDDRSRWRAPWLAAAAVLLVVAAVTAVARVGGDQDRSVIAGSTDDAEVSSLPLPPAGEVRSELLADGTPVWVVRHDDGTVSVLDAVSAHRPYGIGHLVAWCESKQRFDDPAYGSAYAEDGRKVAGPAPTGLDAYTTAVEGDTVVVGASKTTLGKVPPVGVLDRDRPRRGSDCFEATAADPNVVVNTAEPHRVGTGPGFSAEEALRQPTGQVVLVPDANVLIIEGRPSVLCAGPVRSSVPPQCDGPEVSGLQTRAPETWALVKGDFVARVENGTLSDLAATTEIQVESDRANEAASVDEQPVDRPDDAALLSGTTAAGQRWRLDLGGPEGLTPCLSVEADETATASNCVGDGVSGNAADPHRVALLDGEGAPRFVFGAAPEETTSVVVGLMDDEKASASVDRGTVTAVPVDGARFYAVELPGPANSALVRFFTSDGDDMGGRRVTAAPDAPFSFLVTNQSFENPSVVITSASTARWSPRSRSWWRASTPPSTSHSLSPPAPTASRQRATTGPRSPRPSPSLPMRPTTASSPTGDRRASGVPTSISASVTNRSQWRDALDARWPPPHSPRREVVLHGAHMGLSARRSRQGPPADRAAEVGKQRGGQRPDGVGCGPLAHAGTAEGPDVASAGVGDEWSEVGVARHGGSASDLDGFGGDHEVAEGNSGRIAGGCCTNRDVESLPVGAGGQIATAVGGLTATPLQAELVGGPEEDPLHLVGVRLEPPLVDAGPGLGLGDHQRPFERGGFDEVDAGLVDGGAAQAGPELHDGTSVGYPSHAVGLDRPLEHRAVVNGPRNGVGRAREDERSGRLTLSRPGGQHPSAVRGGRG